VITPSTYRKQIIESLRLACSAKQELEYKRKVPIADVVGEMFCEWEDIYHPSVPTFNVAFSPAERTALAKSDRLSGSVADRLETTSLEQFQVTAEWARLAQGARTVLAALGDPAAQLGVAADGSRASRPRLG